MAQLTLQWSMMAFAAADEGDAWVRRGLARDRQVWFVDADGGTLQVDHAAHLEYDDARTAFRHRGGERARCQRATARKGR